MRDEGASYHYVAPSQIYMEVDRGTTAIEGFKTSVHSLSRVAAWSTDGFYRETPDKVAYRIQEGAVLWRWSAPAGSSRPAVMVGACSYFTADSLADLENYDQRDWGAEALKAPECARDGLSLNRSFHAFMIQ